MTSSPVVARQQPPASPEPSGERGDTRLYGRQLTLARAAWVLLALVILVLDVLATPTNVRVLQIACANGTCMNNQLTPAQLRDVRLAGYSLHFYAIFNTVLNWLGVLVCVAVAAVIFWRRSDDRMALFAAFTLLLFGGATGFGTLQVLPESDPRWLLPITAMENVGQIAFYVFFCVFPNGQFVPRWMRWVALLWAVINLAAIVAPVPLQSLVVSPLPFFVFIVLLIFAQVYRYRTVSTPLQRQQTKWVVLGFAVGVGAFCALLIIGNFVLSPDVRNNVQLQFIAQTALTVFLWFIPLSIGVAILRSGLWDIDVLINRTLVYGSLTAVLATVYFICVLGAQAVTQRLTGQTKPQPVIIVASTLLIAALFTPLRRRLQGAIDRRFYRRKYDAAKTLAAFSAALRSEVELGDLQEHLVDIIAETMHPEHVSIWLSPDVPTRPVPVTERQSVVQTDGGME